MSNPFGHELDDPAEAWRFVETFANGCLPGDWSKIVDCLDRLRGQVKEGVLLPDKSVNVGLAHWLNLLVGRVEQYNRSCEEVRKMMEIHYKTFPKWEGPK